MKKKKPHPIDDPAVAVFVIIVLFWLLRVLPFEYFFEQFYAEIKYLFE